MTDQGTLFFLPWLHRGMAAGIAEPSVDGHPVAEAATVRVTITVSDGSGRAVASPAAQAMTLQGSGDVVGLSPGQIGRCDPAPDSRDAEPNYFASVELATADLPWMFTPAAPAGDRLVPWLALVVVTDDADNRLVTSAGSPLPTLAVADPSQLPDLSEAWSWAHAQTSADLSGTSVADAFADEPERFLARLVCPRRLDPDTAYLAAVVPTFEAGRRAGLGLPAPAGADTSVAGWWQAWAADPGPVTLPVYHSWRFRTGPRGDFEQLVRRLRPRELDAGTADFDIGRSGSDRLLPRPPAPVVVSWKGALVSPAARVRPWPQAHADTFREAMRVLVNETLSPAGTRAGPSDAGRGAPDYDPAIDDPVVGPPAYGSYATGADRVPPPPPQGQEPGDRHEPVWLSELNLDPVHRSAAALGADVVRRHQEALMADAWRQATPLTHINRVLNWSRLAAEVGERQVARVSRRSDAAMLLTAAPALRRLRVADATTAAGRLAQTSVPTAAVSTAYQRLARPGGPVGRARGTGRDTSRRTNPAVATTGRYLADPVGALAHAVLVRPAQTQVAAETLLVGVPTGVETDPGARARRATRPARSPGKRVAEPFLPSRNQPYLRRREDLPGRTVQPMPQRFASPGTWEPVRDRVVSVPVLGGDTGALGGLADEIRAALRPTQTLAGKLSDRVRAPGAPFAAGRIPSALQAEPQFSYPLYEWLRAIDPEFLLPGVGEVPDDTVGLTETNAAFVEAFLVGANYELFREFLWREYPAAPGGTWLRTFWDAGAGAEPDIGAVSGWRTGSRGSGNSLGDHQGGVAADGSLVLVIKGELFRKYPDTVIYATRGVWNADRVLADGTVVAEGTVRDEALTGDGAPAERKDPLFGGVLDRSTIFLGFDLTAAAALGPVDAAGNPVPGGAGDDGGWFFVFEEQPAAPRFGLDTGRARQAGADPDQLPRHWRNASWYHLVDDAGALGGLTHATAGGRLAGTRTRPYEDPAVGDPNTFSAAWGTDSAEMARITLQRPVRMLVHASAMLPQDGGAGRHKDPTSSGGTPASDHRRGQPRPRRRPRRRTTGR